MKEIRIDGTDLVPDLVSARRLADSVATVLIQEPVCLSWQDEIRDQESPTHAGLCEHEHGLPGWEEYAVHRGATIKVVVAGVYRFCYRPAAEFAGL